MMTKKKRAQKEDQESPVAVEREEQGLSFEAAIARLGAIVEQLEAGDLPLDDSLALFEEGIQLARASRMRLEKAERRIEQLLSLDDSGQPVAKELEIPERS